jgi:hypothetical protein
MTEDIDAMIREQLRPSMEIMKWRREIMESGGKITEWPPGTVFLDENTDEDAGR